MRRVVGAVICVAVPAALLMSGCNGTTGRDGLPSDVPPDVDATTSADAGDAGVDGEGGASMDAGPDSLLTGLFDADILYADRVLPEAQAAASEAGGVVEGGPSFPNCPPWLGTDISGNLIDYIDSFQQVPGDFAVDGGDVIAEDGSVCATYPWLGSVAVDECVAFSAPPFALLPPCVSALDAGPAVHGDGMGQSRYDLCMALYECYMRTGCYLDPVKVDVTWCFCGASTAVCAQKPQGACLTEALNALEIPSSMAASLAMQIESGFTTVRPSDPLAGLAAHQLNYDFHQAITTHNSCTTIAQQAWAASHDASVD
ncbi:MAG: hypothetical protein ACRENE_28635 [Polyangiaceae bacterium]